MRHPDFSQIPFSERENSKEKGIPFPHSLFESGIPPYLRGPYTTMYTQRPWTIRQYAGFSSAAESNAFYKKNLAHGQKGLSVAFDLPTHRGYDSDHVRASGDVGKAGVAIDSVEDMVLLFDGIRLDDISVSMTMNGAILPVTAFFLVTAEEQGIPFSRLSGTLQNDILKEFMVRNTYIYPPKASMRIVSDIFSYSSRHLPRFNPISISGYHMHEAGASADLELAYTLSNGWTYVQAGLAAGIPLDEFAPRLSFFWGVGMDHFTEIAKLRAGRVLWAYLIQSLNPKDPKSMMLRAHTQTSGWSLTRQEAYNNISRTYLEALSAVLGHTQSLHTNALDEAISLPTDFSARIARNTQIYLQQEPNITSVIDPWGGSEHVEKLTHELIEKAWHHMVEIDSLGGMIKAIEQGIPQRKIEELAVQKQIEIETAERIIVGVNAYRSAEEPPLPVREIDDISLREGQIRRLRERKRVRNSEGVQEALNRLTQAAEGKENLLSAALNAARKRATLGEITQALEQVWGRYKTSPSALSGVYARGMEKKEDYQEARQLSRRFAQTHGRQPRILLAKMGQDGHDRGFKVVATAFSDMGFDVDISPLFQSPEEVAQQAADHDVHFVGVSSLAAGHNTLVPQLLEALSKHQCEHVHVILGGIIPEQDHEHLYHLGVRAIFGPGSVLTESVRQILQPWMEDKTST
ncbi:MAG: methylmalonyl-CoA mutase [Cytophagales bacterium]|nr:methylmalonyl-CoA mutase [Cytophagales bacterium]